MADVPFRTSPFGKLLPKSKPPRLVICGDSKSVLDAAMDNRSSLYWALALSGVDYRFGSIDNLGVNGATASTNATAATNGAGTTTTLGFATDTNVALVAARVAARAAAGEMVVVWIQLGTNSITGSDTSTLAAILKMAAACRIAGASLFCVKDTPPLQSGLLVTAQNTQSSNTRISDWAASQSDVIHLRHYQATVDYASTISSPLGGSGGAAFSTTLDGTHESNYGAYLEGKAMAPQLAAVFPAARLRLGSNGDVYAAFFGAADYPTAGLEANMFKNSAFLGTLGRDGMTKTGTAALTGTIPNDMAVVGNISGTVQVGLSIVDNDYLNGLYKRTDIKMLRVTVSGTPTAADSIRVSNDNTNGGSSPGSRYPVVNGVTPMRGQCLLRTNALTGAQAIGTLGGSSTGDISNSTFASNQFPALSEILFMQSKDANFTPNANTPAYGGPPPAGFSITLINGIACSGSVDLMYADARLILPTPDPL